MSLYLKSLGFVGAGQMAKAIGLSLVKTGNVSIYVLFTFIEYLAENFLLVFFF